MYVGLLTARFPKEMSFADIAAWAGQAGFGGLEVATHHVKPADVLADEGAAVKKILDDAGVRMSSLAHYALFNSATLEEYTAAVKETIQAAKVLDLDVVCLLGGFPLEGKDKMETIREVFPGLYGPLTEEAAKHGIKLAFENWFATNLQNLDHFRAMIDVVPGDNIGFNFDPSHLMWQQIDYIAAVDEFKDRIFHTHAKDTAIRKDVLARVGVQGRGWWRYVIPGFGEISWGRYILALKETGYDGVLSIEHEDRAFEAEEGFEKGLAHLSQFV